MTRTNNPMRNSRANHGFKNVVVAIQPISRLTGPSPNLDIFATILKKFQKNRLLPQVMIASLINNSMYTVPNAWYFKNEDQYAIDAKNQISIACSNRFDFSSIHVLKTESSFNSYLIEELSNFLNRLKSNLLVVLSSNRSALSNYLLGSFAETATLSASTSILVIKPQVQNLSLAPKPKLTLALDPSIKYPIKQMKLIGSIAAVSNAQVNIIGVNPNSPDIQVSLNQIKHLKHRDINLKKFAEFLSDMGVSTSLRMVDEDEPIAKIITDFADKTKSWGIITLSIDRNLMQKIMLGSTARRILTLTQRPFFSLR